MSSHSIAVANRSPQDLAGDLTNLGVRMEVAGEMSSYLIECLRLNQPALIRGYLDWRRLFDSERGGDPSYLLHEIELLLSAAVELPHHIKDEIRSAGDDRSESLENGKSPRKELVNEYLKLLLQGNRRAAHRLIAAEILGGLSIEDLYLEVFQPVLYEVGNRWQRNQLSVGQEHFCTAAIQASMAKVYPLIFSSQRNGKKLIATSVSGNLHEIGIRMVADLLELDGWDTYYLGVDCPSDDILRAIEDNDAKLLAASATMVSQLDELTILIEKVKSSFTPDFPLLVGGNLFNSVPDLWHHIGATACAADAKSAVTAAKQIAGVDP